MIFISLTILIIATAIFSIQISDFNRIFTLILFYAGALILNALYIQSIGSGIGIYSGLFQVSLFNRVIIILTLISSIIILLCWNITLYFNKKNELSYKIALINQLPSFPVINNKLLLLFICISLLGSIGFRIIISYNIENLTINLINILLLMTLSYLIYLVFNTILRSINFIITIPKLWIIYKENKSFKSILIWYNIKYFLMTSLSLFIIYNICNILNSYIYNIYLISFVLSLIFITYFYKYHFNYKLDLNNKKNQSLFLLLLFLVFSLFYFLFLSYIVEFLINNNILSKFIDNNSLQNFIKYMNNNDNPESSTSEPNTFSISNNSTNSGNTSGIVNNPNSTISNVTINPSQSAPQNNLVYLPNVRDVMISESNLPAYDSLNKGKFPEVFGLFNSQFKKESLSELLADKLSMDSNKNVENFETGTNDLNTILFNEIKDNLERLKKLKDVHKVVGSLITETSTNNDNLFKDLYKIFIKENPKINNMPIETFKSLIEKGEIDYNNDNTSEINISNSLNSISNNSSSSEGPRVLSKFKDSIEERVYFDGLFTTKETLFNSSLDNSPNLELDSLNIPLASDLNPLSSDNTTKAVENVESSNEVKNTTNNKLSIVKKLGRKLSNLFDKKTNIPENSELRRSKSFNDLNKK